MPDFTALRRDFPILSQEIGGRRLVYLDSAATAQVPLPVLERVRAHYVCDNANVHRGIHSLSERSTAAYEAARATAAAFLGAEPEEIIFTSGTTGGINLLAQMFAEQVLRPGDAVITTQMEHHSNLVPWQEACRRSGAELRVAPVTDRGELDLLALARLLTPEVKLLAITAVSNLTGTVNPLEAIIPAAHAVGAAVLVDAAQALRHRRIDVRALGCDFLVFSGHKLGSPGGIGVLYAARDRLAQLRPVRFGGGMVDDVTDYEATFSAAPQCFEAGTPNYPAAIGLGAALEYLQEIGLDAIAAHERELLAAYAEMLGKFPTVRILGAPRSRAGALSFTVEGASAFDVAVLLDKLGVAVRSGHHCARPLLRRLGADYAVRISPAFYNDFDEIETVEAALRCVFGVLGVRL